jgi:hypothetical protein
MELVGDASELLEALTGARLVAAQPQYRRLKAAPTPAEPMGGIGARPWARPGGSTDVGCER